MSEKPLIPAPDALLKAKKTPDVVEVPARRVLSSEGAGDPDDPAFAEAIGVLYSVAYGIRFSRKAEGKTVFKVGPLVGEWRADPAYAEEGELPPRDAWRWTLQMDVPADVTAEEMSGVVDAAVTRRGGKLEGSEAARRLELLTTEPARFGRILHIGPYADEPASFVRLGHFLAEYELIREPLHVEVYLSDPGRTAPEKLKTALLVKVA
jgi:hypothetical protein